MCIYVYTSFTYLHQITGPFSIVVCRTSLSTHPKGQVPQISTKKVRNPIPILWLLGHHTIMFQGPQRPHKHKAGSYKPQFLESPLPWLALGLRTTDNLGSCRNVVFGAPVFGPSGICRVALEVATLSQTFGGIQQVEPPNSGFQCADGVDYRDT